MRLIFCPISNVRKQNTTTLHNRPKSPTIRKKNRRMTSRRSPTTHIRNRINLQIIAINRSREQMHVISRGH